MSTRNHGTPCWYELATSPGHLQPAASFYGQIFGWDVEDSGMEDFDYHLAKADGDMVAGLMALPDGVAAMPPFWMIYFAVDDADNFIAEAKAAGASVHRGPEDIPGTGRFAILADPQGAAFGILQADMSAMAADDPGAEPGAGAFNQNKAGHGNWNELMSTDPAAAFAFYAAMFGWTKGEAMDMGEMGTYQLFRHQDADIGGMMGLAASAVPNWLPYFGVDGAVTDQIGAIQSAGGTVHHGPIEVPGGAFIAVAEDPQGAWFAIVGARR
ncbi:VOC family protein [Marinobacter sp. X15-166B]|uniref:VOC family protein n=1 Tax=Marinobacter sp. X15-166B TaxID=1897620 RepID=UPI00085C29FB|nr:VOC family protein [Marinobacter sp. X15-166B]OEY65372.1 bleomycin resistance protein [Marinobacter sp. X15-166B]